jgi:hypothetical protein
MLLKAEIIKKVLKVNNKEEIKVYKVKREVLTVLVFNIRLVLSWFIL